MASDEEICNRALRKLGAARVTSLADLSVEARACNEVYPLARDYLLRIFPWNFATKRAALAPLTSTPEWGFGVEYQLPADCLRLLEVDGLKEDEWYVEDSKLVTNQTAVANVKYTARIEDVAQYDPGYIIVLGDLIALDLCEHLTQSNTKKQALREEFLESFRQARIADSIEGVPETLNEDDWLIARV